MTRRYVKPHWSPSSDILAIMASCVITQTVNPFVVSQECVLKAADVAVLHGEFQFYRNRMIKLHEGQTIYFVAEPSCPDWAYIVVQRTDGSYTCTCNDGLHGKACPHTEAVDSSCRELATAQEQPVGEECEAVAAEATADAIAEDGCGVGQSAPVQTTDEPATAATEEPVAAVEEAERILAQRRRYTEQTVAHLVARTELQNGTVLYEFASVAHPGRSYFITAKNGYIDFDTHTDCEGYLVRHQCAHVDMVGVLEAANHAVSSAHYELQYKSIAHRAPYIEAARHKLAQAEETARVVYALPLAEQLERARREAYYPTRKRMEKYIVL